jgi:hypothetical protein
MEETHKQFTIRSGAATTRDSNEWKPMAQVNWTEAGHDRVKLWMPWCFACTFATYNGAESQGHLFAKDWIERKGRADTRRK